MNNREYYEKITNIDIGIIARELLQGRIVNATAAILKCDCPNHQSISKESLHINLHKQNWYCFGCGLGGDVLHLVEFIQSTTVTKNITGVMTESHRQARDYLAAKIGLPALSTYGMTPEQV